MSCCAICKTTEHLGLNSIHDLNLCLLRIHDSHRDEKPSNTLRLLLAVAISSEVLPWLIKTYSHQPTKFSSLCIYMHLLVYQDRFL